MKSLINKILKESEEEFDWVHVNDMEEPKGIVLYNIVKNFFNRVNPNFYIEIRDDGQAVYIRHKNLGYAVLQSYWISNFTIKNVLTQLSDDLKEIQDNNYDIYYYTFRNLSNMLHHLFKSLTNKNIKESEEDFGWTDEFLNFDVDKPKQVSVGGKRYCIESQDSTNGWSSNGFRTTNWTGWYDVIDLQNHRGELCYVVNFGTTYPKVYMPIQDFKKENIIF